MDTPLLFFFFIFPFTFQRRVLGPSSEVLPCHFHGPNLHTSRHCLKETEQSCEFYDNVFETDRKRLELRAPCFSPHQLAFSSPRCLGSGYLTRAIHLPYVFSVHELASSRSGGLQFSKTELTCIVFLVVTEGNMYFCIFIITSPDIHKQSTVMKKKHLTEL